MDSTRRERREPGGSLSNGCRHAPSANYTGPCARCPAFDTCRHYHAIAERRRAVLLARAAARRAGRTLAEAETAASLTQPKLF